MLSEKVSQALRMYHPGIMSDLITMWKILDKNNISKEEAIEFHERQQKLETLKRAGLQLDEKQKEVLDALKQICPECSRGLQLLPITTENAAGNKSMWRCSGCKNCNKKYVETNEEEECTYERGDKRSLYEIQEEYQKKVEQIILGEI